MGRRRADANHCWSHCTYPPMKISRHFRFMRRGAFGIVEGLTALPTIEIASVIVRQITFKITSEQPKISVHSPPTNPAAQWTSRHHLWPSCGFRSECSASHRCIDLIHSISMCATHQPLLTSYSSSHSPGWRRRVTMQYSSSFRIIRSSGDAPASQARR